LQLMAKELLQRRQPHSTSTSTESTNVTEARIERASVRFPALCGRTV
jgi:hypothetical protein